MSLLLRRYVRLLPVVIFAALTGASDAGSGPNASVPLRPTDGLFQITDSGWDTFSETSDCVLGTGDDQWQLTLTQARALTVTVNDCCCPGDFYQVAVDGSLIGTTPNLAPPWGCDFSGPLSSGSFTTSLAAGVHLITVRDAGLDGHSAAEIANEGMCPAGFEVIGTLVGVELQIQPDPPIIPTASRVQAKHVLTSSDLTLTVTMDGQPDSGVAVTLQSDRGSTDTIIGPTNTTDASGMTAAQVQTRAQPGPSTISSADPTITTTSPAVITWFPADYESSFLVTCYVLSSESDFLSSPLVGPINGLPANKRYHRGFISDVKLQGSGIALDGSTIRYDGGGTYSLANCPLTSTGVCAVDGTTAAVDPTVVPYRSTISIDSVGSRVAQDTGGAITNYHIDVYFGTRRADCLAAGRRTLDVTFESY
jgi:3D (Asp-Asp-Asp) domain-containing protein